MDEPTDTPIAEALSKTLEDLHDFAVKHQGDRYAATVLMSFCAGDCIHLYGSDDACELCGVRRQWSKPG